MNKTGFMYKAAAAFANNPTPVLERFFPDTLAEDVGRHTRLQPCPACGHRGCCTIIPGTPRLYCYSTSCKLGRKDGPKTIVEYLLTREGVTEHDLFAFLAETYKLELPDESESRLQTIKAKAVEHYHNELMNSPSHLEHQLEVRKHSPETLALFKVGIASNYEKLEQDLMTAGYSKKEIDEAAVWVRPGLFIYPYYNWKTGEVLRINTKGIPDGNGEKPKGYSLGAKVFYTTPKISKKRVILVEGENDLLSLYEAGEDSVIAFGGNPSKEQIRELVEMVDSCEAVYLMFDNDKGGYGYLQFVSQALPHKYVYLVKYEGKDPDWLLKESDGSVSLEDLFRNATLLPSDGYTIRRKGHLWNVMTRDSNLRFLVKERDKKGLFHGDIEVWSESSVVDAKVNSKLSTYRHKALSVQHLFGLQKEMERFYDAFPGDMDLADLMASYQFTTREAHVVKRMAEVVSKLETLDADTTYIGRTLGNNVRDRVLHEINQLANAELDLDKPIPKIKIAQSFSIPNNEAFFYFTRKVQEDGNMVMIPYLLSNKKELIRLDLIKKQSPQTLLLIKGRYQLRSEVPTAITELEKISLHQRWVDRYVNNEIDPKALVPALLIRRLESQVKRFLYHSDTRVYQLLAIWIYGTYAYELFAEYPYIHFSGNKGSGKSTGDNVVRSYAFNPTMAVHITAAALFRMIDSMGGTFILDELEGLTSRGKTIDSELAPVIKGGYSRSTGEVIRCNPDNGNIPEAFDTYSPKVISNIFGIDDVIGDRTIEIQMVEVEKEKHWGLDKISTYKENHLDEVTELTSLCCLSVLENFQRIWRVFTSTEVEGKSARLRQLMGPLVTIATIAGDDYVEALKSYYEERIMASKAEVEEATPEGSIKNILREVALELLGRQNSGWVSRSKEFCPWSNTAIIKYDDGFRVNQVWLKLAMDSNTPGIKYPYSQMTKYIKRIFGKIGLDSKVPRTTITLISNDPLARELNTTVPSANNFRFYFKDLVPDWDKQLEVAEEPPKGPDLEKKELDFDEL